MKFCPATRPFSSIEEMNSTLIKNWNNKVGPDDTVYHLGDFAFGNPKWAKECFYAVRGKKHLIYGNHDKKHIKELPWDSQGHYLELNIDRIFYILFHYPISSWNGSHHGSFHLYGHVHGKSPIAKIPNALDVGIDNGYPAPIELSELTEIFKERNRE